MAESTMHIMIIWSKAEGHKDFIIDDLKKEFCVIKIFKFYWTKKLFIQNLSIFYSHSLKDIPSKKMNGILKNKRKRVGSNGFYAIVFEDLNPDYQERNTTSGIRVVNAHVFDKKISFRRMTGGGSRIHCSDNSWETNKDLTILMGLNLGDFLQKYPRPSAEIEELNCNCIGVGGYDSIQQLFYVLNNTVRYCVLRNHECIPDEYTVEGHGDIDLLVEHKNYVVRLTGAAPVYPLPYRVYHIIQIGGKEIPFDFRFVGDNYYDSSWEETILQTRMLRKGLFYTPDPTNQYYTLLYHAYVQKPYVKPDYLPKLAYYASQIGLQYESSIVKSIKQLQTFLSNSHYQYVQPEDRSVYYNVKNLQSLSIWEELNNSPEIEGIEQINESYNSLSSFYYFRAIVGGEDVFIKYGGIGESCLNEYNHAKKAYSISPKHFVKPLGFREGKKGNYILFEWIDGISVEDYLCKADTLRKNDIKIQMVEIYDALQKAEIMHRDIRPGNLLVVGDTLKLIDFQYSIDSKKMQELECVKSDVNVAVHLGNSQFKYKSYAWRDSASIKKCLIYYGIDVKDVQLSSDKAYYMSMYKCYKYLSAKKAVKFKKRIIKELKLYYKMLTVLTNK